MGSKPVSLQDIAAKAGVSKVTVSYALNGSGRVSAETRKLIQELARDMDYRPQLAAKLLRSNQKGQLGLIVAGQTERFAETGFSGPILGAFIEACENIGNGYHIEISSFGTGRRFIPPRCATGGMVDGLLIAGKTSPELEQWLLEQNTLPWIGFDEPAEYCVIQAFDVGVIRTIQYLCSMGHKRIAFVGGPKRYSQHGLGLEGFKRASQTFNLDIRYEKWISTIEIGLDTAADDFIPWAMDFLDTPDRPTAIHCQDLRFALALCYAAREHGLRVPDDLSIVGTGPSGYAENTCPALTALQPNYISAVNRAVGMLQQLIRGQRVIERQCWIEPTLVLRHSSGQAPHDA